MLAILFPLLLFSAGPGDEDPGQTPEQGSTPTMQHEPEDRHEDDRGHDHGHGSEAHHEHVDRGDRARATHRFEDADKWSEIWDDPERDEWQEPSTVVDAMEIAAGMTVADLGAGTGYFNRHLSAAVGPQGRVYPVDVEPNMVAHMVERARREETPNVHPILGEYADPKIPDGEIDRILIVNTYHHIDERRAYFARLLQRLSPGGLLINVDWKPGTLDKGPAPEHKLHPEEVAIELHEAGFRLRAEHALTYQYVQVYEAATDPR